MLILDSYTLWLALVVRVRVVLLRWRPGLTGPDTGVLFVPGGGMAFGGCVRETVCVAIQASRRGSLVPSGEVGDVDFTGVILDVM